MTGWDLLTWVALAILGPGSIIIFIVFVRDLLGQRRNDSEPPGRAPLC